MKKKIRIIRTCQPLNFGCKRFGLMTLILNVIRFSGPNLGCDSASTLHLALDGQLNTQSPVLMPSWPAHQSRVWAITIRSFTRQLLLSPYFCGAACAGAGAGAAAPQDYGMFCPHEHHHMDPAYPHLLPSLPHIHMHSPPLPD